MIFLQSTGYWIPNLQADAFLPSAFVAALNLMGRGFRPLSLSSVIFCNHGKIQTFGCKTLNETGLDPQASFITPWRRFSRYTSIYNERLAGIIRSPAGPMKKCDALGEELFFGIPMALAVKLSVVVVEQPPPLRQVYKPGVEDESFTLSLAHTAKSNLNLASWRWWVFRSSEFSFL